jgi:arabinogalactan oligomer / maltooligosaccharide transport system substrate-binding protein
MATALQTVVTGKAEPQKALDEAVKQIQSNIEANHSN